MPSREPDALPHKNNINRANVEETDHGLKVCWGLHASGHECEWEYFVPDAERQRLREALRESVDAVIWMSGSADLSPGGKAETPK